MSNTSTPTNLIFLKEDGHPEIPSSLNPHEFGSETICDSDGKVLAYGTSYHIRGSVKDIRNYLEKIGSPVWTSNNPMLGDWVQKSL